MKKNYPLVLIASGFFLVFFPFDTVGTNNLLGDMTVFLYSLYAVLIVGFASYYKKRNAYSVRTRKAVKLAAVAIPLFFVAAVFVGIAMGVSIVFFPPSYENTDDIDTDLLEKKVLDWVNTNRYKNNVGGVNLNDSLNDLARIRSAEIIHAPPEEIEPIANIDANDMAKKEGIKCMIDGKSANIYDYVLIMPHNAYPDIEKLTDYFMTSMTNDDAQRAIVFAPNVTKTGIDSFVTKDNLFVIQNFC